jgi:tetratricopeptide (TPR) repeat protein
MEHIQLALKLDPMNPFIITFYAVDLMFIRKYDAAIRAFQEALQIAPGYPFALGNLWQAYYLKGDYVRAWDTFQSILKAQDPEMLGPCEQAYADNGIEGALNAYAAGLELRSEEQYLNPTEIASIYALTGMNDKAIFWLERAWEARDPNLPYLLLPVYDHLRDDPRFRDISRRMNLPYRPPSV